MDFGVFRICSLEFLPNECETAVVVIGIFKELSRAKVWMKSGKVSSSLCKSCMGSKRKRALIGTCLARL